MNWYYYLTEEEIVIRVRSRRKPVHRQTSYVVHEPSPRPPYKFEMACFPEISGWKLINTMTYIGKTPFKPVTTTGEPT